MEEIKDYEEKMAELEKKKEEVRARIEKEQNQIRDRVDTKRFYGRLIDELKSGARPPSEVIEFEEIDIPPPDEIARMDAKSHQILEEKMELAEELRSTRKQMERRELENAVAEDILKERETNLEKKIREMTPAERFEFEQRTRGL